MGVYVNAYLKDENDVFCLAPMDPFISNSLIGIYSKEHPYFKFTSDLFKLFRSAGYEFNYSSVSSGGIFLSTNEILQLYGNLVQSLASAHYPTGDTIKSLLHFIGICLANRYVISIG